jgi:hypothetical protein
MRPRRGRWPRTPAGRSRRIILYFVVLYYIIAYYIILFNYLLCDLGADDGLELPQADLAARVAEGAVVGDVLEVRLGHVDPVVLI